MNATSWTPSSLRASRSPACSFDGYRGARAVIMPTRHHTQGSDSCSSASSRPGTSIAWKTKGKARGATMEIGTGARSFVGEIAKPPRKTSRTPDAQPLPRTTSADISEQSSAGRGARRDEPGARCQSRHPEAGSPGPPSKAGGLCTSRARRHERRAGRSCGADQADVQLQLLGAFVPSWRLEPTSRILSPVAVGHDTDEVGAAVEHRCTPGRDVGAHQSDGGSVRARMQRREWALDAHRHDRGRIERSITLSIRLCSGMECAF